MARLVIGKNLFCALLVTLHAGDVALLSSLHLLFYVIHRQYHFSFLNSLRFFCVVFRILVIRRKQEQEKRDRFSQLLFHFLTF